MRSCRVQFRSGDSLVTITGHAAVTPKRENRPLVLVGAEDSGLPQPPKRGTHWPPQNEAEWDVFYNTVRAGDK